PVVIVNHPAICFGTTGQLSASGGTTYTWAPSTGLNNTGIANPIANPAVTTSYTVTVTNINGCKNTGITSVVVNPLPVVTVNQPTICVGANAQLNASGGKTYSWIPLTGLNNPNIANPVSKTTMTQTYTVIATDAKGCSNSNITTVVVNPL